MINMATPPSYNPDLDCIAHHHFVMLALAQLVEYLLHDLSVLLRVHGFLHKVEPVNEAVLVINVGEHGAGQMIIDIVNAPVRQLPDKLCLVLLQYLVPDVVAMIAADLHKIVLKNTPDHVQQRDGRIEFLIFRPQRGIGVLHRVNIARIFRKAVRTVNARSNRRMVVHLADHEECHRVIVLDHVIGDFSVEISIVGQNEYLIYVATGDVRMQQFHVIVADADHLPDHGAHNEQRSTIHAGDRIVDDDYLVAIVGYILNIRSADNSLLAGSPASFYQVVEVVCRRSRMTRSRR